MRDLRTVTVLLLVLCLVAVAYVASVATSLVTPADIEQTLREWSAYQRLRLREAVTLGRLLTATVTTCDISSYGGATVAGTLTNTSPAMLRGVSGKIAFTVTVEAEDGSRFDRTLATEDLISMACIEPGAVARFTDYAVDVPPSATGCYVIIDRATRAPIYVAGGSPCD